MAGGMSQPVEGVRQIMGRADGRQVANCDTALITGTGGIMEVSSPR